MDVDVHVDMDVDKHNGVMSLDVDSHGIITCNRDGWPPAASPPAMTRCSQKSTKSAEWLADRIELDVKAGRFEKGRRRWYLGRLLLIQTRFGGRLFRISSVTWGSDQCK